MPLLAWLAGLHLVRAGAVRAPFQGSHPAADHGDERSRDRARRLRECRAGDLNIVNRAKPGDHRHLLDRRHRNQGRRRRRLSSSSCARAIRSSTICGIVYVSTPDFKDAFQDGWAKTVTRMVESLVETPPLGAAARRKARQRPARAAISRRAISTSCATSSRLSVWSRLSCPTSPARSTATSPTTSRRRPSAASPSKTSPPWAAPPGRSRSANRCATRRGAGAAGRRSVPTVRPPHRSCARTTISSASCREISGRPVPLKYRRQRGQLVDAMLDGHFHFGGKQDRHRRRAGPAVQRRRLAHGDGRTIDGGGDDDALAAARENAHRRSADRRSRRSRNAAPAGCDLLITHSHGRQAAERLGIPLFRMGLPMFDRHRRRARALGRLSRHARSDLRRSAICSSTESTSRRRTPGAAAAGGSHGAPARLIARRE